MGTWTKNSGDLDEIQPPDLDLGFAGKPRQTPASTVHDGGGGADRQSAARNLLQRGGAQRARSFEKRAGHRRNRYEFAAHFQLDARLFL